MPRAAATQLPPVRHELIRLIGGLDLVTPTLSLPAGVLRDALNYEVSVYGGYSRIKGYERFDGHSNPSDVASYATLTTTATLANVVIGDTITGFTSGAVAVVLDLRARTIVYTQTSGVFQVGETIKNGGLTVGVVSVLGDSAKVISTPKTWVNVVVGNTITGFTSGATGVVTELNPYAITYVPTSVATFALSETVKRGSDVVGTVSALDTYQLPQQKNAQYVNLATDVFRALIGPVPGSGPVRGVVRYNGDVYAWRNNVGGTALVMHVATPTGWSPVSLGYELAFNTGLAAGIAVGDSISGLSSGATGIVSAVVVQSGDFTTNDAAGRLILSATTGLFSGGEAIRVSGTTRATNVGAAAAITLAPNGRVSTYVGGFGGTTALNSKLYGADGVNRGFEFDGTAYIPIDTGMSPDKPTLTRVHQNQLFFVFGSSLQHSGIGTPYIWSPVYGAGELAVGDTITDWYAQRGAQTTGALVVYTRYRTYILYGTSSADWNLVNFSPNTGALAHTAQMMSSGFALNDQGVASLEATLRYGNFADAALTAQIRPWVQVRKNLAIASSLNREKAQYRLFFSDGYALYLTYVNGKSLGCMPVQFPVIVSVACEGETPDGVETNFFGATNGYVYRLDSGTSFDGEPIPSMLLLNFAPQGDSRNLKSYRRGSLEIQGPQYAELSVGYKLAYADADRIDQGMSHDYALTRKGLAYWDLFTWDDFVWDGVSLYPAEIEVLGTAENVAILISNNSDYFDAYTINSLILHYIVRRGLH